MRRGFLLGVLVCFAAACGGSSPTEPTALDIAGTWTGTITSNQVSGSGPVSATFSQSDASVSGTWSIIGPDGPDSGTLSGTLSGSSVTLRLVSKVPTGCPYTMNATVSGNRMTGIYSATFCSVAVSGGVDLTKQQ